MGRANWEREENQEENQYQKLGHHMDYVTDQKLL